MWIFYPFPPASPPPPSQFSGRRDSPAPALGPAFRSTRSCHNNYFSGPRSPGGLRTGTPPRCRRAGAIGHVDCIRFKRSAIEELEVLGRIGDCAALFSKKLIDVYAMLLSSVFGLCTRFRGLQRSCRLPETLGMKDTSRAAARTMYRCSRSSLNAHVRGPFLLKVDSGPLNSTSAAELTP
ncbi:unnamed protein product [Prorocentrum cordatum]|uniref:Uncharacterized protein n=1 Tax=Prorocentrum cordatum TaxID=2364126 RepID=A0ABN9TN71_9DINO|nr:unnamed protein product [Polarella glacialis]